MTDAADQLPDDLASAHAMILAERAARREAEAVAARAQAVNSHSDALIARLRLEIEKLRRDIHASRSERKARLLEQMELQLEELEADASQDELAAAMAARSSTVKPLSVGVPRASRFRSICRANVSSLHRQQAAHAAARPSWRNWARTLPRHWK